MLNSPCKKKSQTMSSCMKLLDLPEECISHILSLTSPKDVVRSSAVSKLFLSVLESDSVWSNFLPFHRDHFISQLLSPLLDQQHFASNKQLYFYLCHSPILFNNNTQSFSLDKLSGKKCIMLGARMLVIAWGDNPEYWTWKPVRESRFPEAAQLESVCWLDIKGRLPIKFLSSNTTYGAYFVFQRVDDTLFGFDEPVKAFVLEVDEGLPKNNDDHSIIVNHCYLDEPQDDILSIRSEELSKERDDGWIEVEMGRYQTRCNVEGADERVVLEMTLKEVEDLRWKSGLIVQGIGLIIQMEG